MFFEKTGNIISSFFLSKIVIKGKQIEVLANKGDLLDDYCRSISSMGFTAIIPELVLIFDKGFFRLTLGVKAAEEVEARRYTRLQRDGSHIFPSFLALARREYVPAVREQSQTGKYRLLVTLLLVQIPMLGVVNTKWRGGD